jgi:hypothetical protein
MGIPVCDRPGYRPDNDRQQLAALARLPGTAPAADELDEIRARLEAVEARLADLDRRHRADGARFRATMRRDKLRGRR